MKFIGRETVPSGRFSRSFLAHRGVTLFLVFLSSLTGLALAQPWAGIISPSRAVDWSAAGVPGGIPSRTTICATLNPGATGTQIGTAIKNCPAGQTVRLTAGTYNISGGVTFGAKSNVTLRGDGADKTLLVFSSNNSCLGYYGDVCLGSQDVNWTGGPSNTADWTAGYAKGTTSITLSSKTNLAVGTPLILDQKDDTTDGGAIFVCYTPQGVCSTNGDSGGGPRSGRSQQQLVTVTSISGSGPYTIGISPAIRMPNWVASKTPQAWWSTNPISMSGIEDMSLDHSAAEPNVGSGTGIAIVNCNGCWVKGVRSIKAGRSHVMIVGGIRSTIESNYFFDTAGHTSTSYGVEVIPSADTLVHNNIFQAISEPVPINGTCSGCVMAYNFDINNTYDGGTGSFTWMMQSTMTHAVGAENILIEGNQGAGVYSDNFHGTHQFVTVFRNAFNGFQKNSGQTTSGSTLPVILDSYSRFYNVIGNVLGDPTKHTNYEKNVSKSGTTSVASNTSIYSIGFGNQIPNDPVTAQTLMRWGNWDVVTKAARWCGNSSSPGWTTTCGSSSEIPTGITTFPNTVPASTTLPASFYLSGKPSWWPASKPWPNIGPDVNGGTLANSGGHAYPIPAADCYSATMGGSTSGTGSVLSFNASRCYGQSNAPANPLPPTSLSATIQ